MGKNSAATGANQEDDEDQSTSQKVLGGIGAGLKQGLSSMDQQPPMVQAGPQLGAPVNQAPQQMQDPYAQNIQQLGQKKQQVDFFGNPIGSGY